MHMVCRRLGLSLRSAQLAFLLQAQGQGLSLNQDRLLSRDSRGGLGYLLR